MPHMDAAYNLARWLARSPADADDIVQDAMLRAFRGIDSFRGGDARPWLLTIVRNCCITAGTRRRGKTDVPLDEVKEESEALRSDDANPETAAISAGEAGRLDRLIEQLPGDYREVLILREMEDLSYREIAAIAGIPVGTVMSRLARARALLKEKWLKSTGGCHGLQ